MVFALYQQESAVGKTCVPPQPDASPLPPHAIPRGCPRVLALGALPHASHTHKTLQSLIALMPCHHYCSLVSH